MEITGETSDGYHTFNELYDHRMALTAALTRALPQKCSVRSRSHHPKDGPMFEGMFIVVVTLPAKRNETSKQISYHYNLEHWDAFAHVVEADEPPKWDGHTAADSVERLLRYAHTPRYSTAVH